MWAIIICTVLYVAIALVLTGMVKYDQLAVGDPLAFVFEKLNLKWLSGIIAVSAIVAMASVLLVFQLGQPRIWMSMSRDGLLPKSFARIHPKFKTPSFSTIVTGFVVAVPALFMNLTMVTDLCSIGTLFAFVLVCAGVLKLQNTPGVVRGKFKIPYINSAVIMPLLLVIILGLLYVYNRDNMESFLMNKKKLYDPTTLVSTMTPEEIQECKTYFLNCDSLGVKASNNDLESYLSNMDYGSYETLIVKSPLKDERKFESGWDLFKHKIPLWIFFIITAYVTFLCITKKLSLIPVLGLVSCLYMMAELGISNWIGFSIWLVVGLIIYFTYSYKHSKLNTTNNI
jgi:amino acid transporter